MGVFQIIGIFELPYGCSGQSVARSPSAHTFMWLFLESSKGVWMRFDGCHMSENGAG